MAFQSLGRVGGYRTVAASLWSRSARRRRRAPRLASPLRPARTPAASRRGADGSTVSPVRCPGARRPPRRCTDTGASSTGPKDPAGHFRTSVHASGLFAAAVLDLLDAGGCRSRPSGGPATWSMSAPVAASCCWPCATCWRPATGTGSPAGSASRRSSRRTDPARCRPAIGWSSELPEGAVGLLVANEWLDNVPVDVVEVAADGPHRVLVEPSTGRESPGGPVGLQDAAWLARWWPLAGAGEGDRAEIGLGPRPGLGGGGGGAGPRRGRRRRLRPPARGPRRGPVRRRDAHRLPGRARGGRRPGRLVRHHRARRDRTPARRPVERPAPSRRRCCASATSCARSVCTARSRRRTWPGRTRPATPVRSAMPRRRPS